MRVYLCNACGGIIENPHKVRMKEFYYHYEVEGFASLVTVPFTRTTKIHLCEECYKNLKNLVNGRNSKDDETL